MEFRILGSFGVVGTAGVLDLLGAKRRGLLACLLINAGRLMSTERLVEELWVPVAPRVRPARSRRTCVSYGSCCRVTRQNWLPVPAARCAAR
jgi:hypothetical protein